MPATNTTQTYGGVTKAFHWLTALLIFTVIPLGIIANGIPLDTSEQIAQKAWLFSLHKTVGITIFFVALARILWALSQPKPLPLHPDRKAETFLAAVAHWTLYASLLLVPLTGWIHHAATTGFAPIYWPFGQSLPLVPKDDGVAHTFASLHIIFERVLVVSLFLHIAGALKHVFIDKDVTLKRMLPGETAVPTLTQKEGNTSPLIAAVLAYAAAIGIGAGLGLFAQHDTTAETVTLEQVASDWQVESGTLGITVKQFGSDVTGGFADWTAAITFDETPTDGTHGTFDVTIAIPSLTLGSVTSQALGADFFNATEFATATYSGDILPAEQGYLAQGILTLKGAEVPVAMPFQLADVGGLTEMTGGVTLDRRDFGIGDHMPDESSLNFAVEVEVTLTAKRAP